jgi:hypothetical protein
LRFEKPPGFWGRLKNSVVDWVKDHADVLKKISGVLKIISAISGVLAMIPFLAPVMGPIALVSGGLALGIDVTLKLATGEGSWGSIIFDAATMALPGVGKLVKPLVMGSKGGRAINALAGKGTMFLKNRASIAGGKYLAGAKSMLTAKVPVTLRSPAFAGAPGDMMAMSKNVPAVLNPRAAAAAFRRGADEHIPTIKISSSKYPETASHVRDAQKGRNWAGDKVDPANVKKQPDVVTVNRSGATANRKASTGQYESRGKEGLDRDEYPPAMFAEGGKGASVKYISGSDNRGAGSTMGWDIRGAGIKDQQQVRIVVS